MTDLNSSHLLALALVLGLPPILGLVLKSARLPGWSVLGGLLAGLLIGPTILGHVRPDLFESIFMGGIEQRETLDDLLHEQDRDRFIAMEMGAGDEYAQAMLQRHEEERTEAELALVIANEAYRTPLRVFMVVFATYLLLGASTGRIHVRDERQGLIAPFTIGLWSALLPGGLAFAMMYWLWPQPLEVALLASAAMMIGPWILSPDDVESADHAEHGGAHMIQRAGHVASVIALCLVGWVCITIEDQTSMLWMVCLLGLPVSWLLPPIQSIVIRRVLDSVVFPVLACFVMLRIDMNQHANLWMILLFVLLCGDGRWLGAFFGAMMLGGRKSLRTMRLVMGTMSCGPTMLVVTLLGVEIGLLPPPIALSLALGVALIEVTAPTRRNIARQLVQAEEEIEEIENQL
ncbi:MAG: hypothetical protein O7G85_04405 [Planctomycetota bacterium]|nr:hypothetical protein [Planctomycetota bacterium]